MFTRVTKRGKGSGKSVFSPTSLTQTRLDVLTQPLPEHSDAVHETRKKIRLKPHVYTFDVLTDRAEHLDLRIAALEPGVQRPAPSTTPDEWLNSKRRLARLEGERLAIRLALDGSFCGSGSAQPTSTPAPAPEDWTQDPFLSE